MQNAFGVCALEGARDLSDELLHARERQAIALRELRLERQPFQQFHHDVGGGAHLSVIHDLNDVARLASEVSGYASFQAKARNGLGPIFIVPRPSPWREELDRDVLEQGIVPSEPHFAHRSTTEDVQE